MLEVSDEEWNEALREVRNAYLISTFAWFSAMNTLAFGLVFLLFQVWFVSYLLIGLSVLLAGAGMREIVPKTSFIEDDSHGGNAE